MKRIAILLNWSINSDSRAQRTAYSLSKSYIVHVYCISCLTEGMPKLLDNGIEVLRISPQAATILDKLFLPFYSNSNAIYSKVLNSHLKYDAVYCHDIDTLWTGHKLSKKMQARLIYDIHDLSILTLNQGFNFKVNLLIRSYYYVRKFIMSLAYSLVERIFIQKCDLIFTVNESLSEYISKSYEVKCKTIYNYPLFNDSIQPSKLAYLKNENSFKIVLYHGNFGRGRYLEEIVKSAFYFHDDLLLVMIGSGELSEELVRISNKANTIFFNHVEYSELLDYVKGADIGLVLLEHINFSKKHASANKLYEYMAAGLAILSSNSPELNKVVSKTSMGIVLENISVRSIADSLNTMSMEDSRLKKWRINAKNLFHSEFAWSLQEEKLLNMFSEILE